MIGICSIIIAKPRFLIVWIPSGYQDSRAFFILLGYKEGSARRVPAVLGIKNISEDLTKLD